MSSLRPTIDLYLKMNTNYALLINGAWGSGKTHYYKNVLEKQISDTPTFHDASKTYKPILISLFGVKSLDEIQSQILLTLVPMAKNKGVKIAANIGKSLLKGILSLKGLEDVYQIFSEIEVEKKDWLKFQDFVMCFDDLERRNKDLRLDELTGFINSLVENENVKILLLANEDRILEPEYKALKEKIVSSTIEFIQNKEEVFSSIVENIFSGFVSYKKFLLAERENIIAIFGLHSDNLRTLIFSLNYFHHIFSTINDILISDKILEQKKKEIQLGIFQFIFAVSNEYKEGKITFKRRAGIDESVDRQLTSLFNSEEQNEEVPYAEVFYQKYYKDQQYYFFDSVYEFITGSGMLDREKFERELSKAYHVQHDKEMLPQYLLLDKLNYSNCFILSNKEYIKLTTQLHSFAKSGKFELRDYAEVFRFIARFGNPLKIELSKLQANIITGMKKAKLEHIYDEDLYRIRSIYEEQDLSEHVLRIRDVAIQINEEVLNKTLKKQYQTLENLLYSEFHQFYSQVLDREKNRYFLEPIFYYFDPSRFYSFLVRDGKKHFWDILKFMSSRYKSPYFTFKKELPFFDNLLVHVSKQDKKNKSTNVNGYYWSELHKSIDEATENIRKSKDHSEPLDF